MKNVFNNNLLICLALICSAYTAFFLKPTKLLNDQRSQINLESMIPKQFGDWKIDETLIPIKVSPDVQENLDKIYNQTLSRTYINSNGKQVMLSVAYGSNQSSSLQVHRPDICYTAQGFQVGKKSKNYLRLYAGSVPVMHMVASQGQRNEPITYWITVGDKAVRGGWEQKIAKIQYGLTGKVPDGILVRVSNISLDEEDSYKVHESFVNNMLNAMKKDDQIRLVGLTQDGA